MDNPDSELSILFLDDPQIAELNSTYLHRTGPTNVIAFPMRDEQFASVNPHLLGDVVISTETAFREAEKAGCDLEQRLIELLIHGILHLLGFDHEDSNDRAVEMEKKSREMLALLGYMET